MCNNIKDGGPAFPLEQPHPDGGTFSSQGMSLRDYFAAKAMQVLLADPDRGEQSREDVAWLSYVMADAMLKARRPSNA